MLERLGLEQGHRAAARLRDDGFTARGQDVLVDQ
jgi:hypothetical protein